MKSLVAYIVSVVVILYAGLVFCPRYERSAGESTFGWDVSGYYWYLPSVFVYHDLKKQEFADSVIKKYQFTPGIEQGYRADNGGFVLTYSSGMALLYSPFFAAAHVLARPLGYPADGFSKPYQAAISLGSLLICLVGLWYYRKLLRYYYSDSVTAIMILLLAIGTNYLNYSAIDGALTHNWLFTLYVFLLLATRAYYASFKTKYAIAVGLLCGVAILIRPSEIVSVLIPLLWGMESISLRSIGERFRFYGKHIRQLLLAVLCVVAVGSIQLFYWKYVSGHWIVYSYAEKGFSWKHPHLSDYALSYRSGWITYTPLIALCIIGILPFLKWGHNKVAVLTFFALNFYVVSAWDIWWYGGTGGRAMIQSYPVILLPMAALIDYLWRRRMLLWLASPIMLLAVYFNIWFTVQAHAGEGLYDPEGMTKAYYWRVAGRWHVSREIQKLKDTDELPGENAKTFTPLFENDFESDTSIAPAADAIEGRRSIRLNRSMEWSPKSVFALPAGLKGWIRAEATFRIKGKEWTGWKMTQFIVGFLNHGAVVKERMIRVQRLLNENETKPVFIDVKIPDLPVDSCRIQFWNVESDQEILIDRLRVSSFKAD